MGLKTLRRPYDSDEELNNRSEQLFCDCGKEAEYSKKFNAILCDECFDEKLAK